MRCARSSPTRSPRPTSRPSPRCAGSSRRGAARSRRRRRTRSGLLIKAALGAVRQVLPVSDLAKEHPQLVVPSQDAQWWLLSNSDGALVSSADGTTTSWYQRDPELFRTLMTQSRGRTCPAVPRVAEAAQALPRRRGRGHLAAALARDVRGVRPQGLRPDLPRSTPVRATATVGVRPGGGYFLASTASPVESAAMKASCGTSTRPTIFIRFLPSFCFSSSLRLRVMSPP